MRNGLIAILALFVCIGSASGADFNMMVDQAKAAYNGGNSIEAVQRLKDSVLYIWDGIPLTLRNVRFVTDTETYATRPNNIYRSGEEIHVAGELLGYKLKKIGEIYSIDIVTDFYVSDEKGKVLGGVQEFGKFSITSFIPTTDFRLDLTYSLTDAPPGAYQIRTVIHDKNSDKRTEFTEIIRIQ